MEALDMTYLFSMLEDLSGLPVRVCGGEDRAFYGGLLPKPCGPASADSGQMLRGSDHIGCFVTEDLRYYGIIRAGDRMIAVGPTRQSPAAERELRKGTEADSEENARSAIQKGQQESLKSVLQMLCILNYLLNGERMTPGELGPAEPLQRPEEERPDTGTRGSGEGSAAAHAPASPGKPAVRMTRRGGPRTLRKWSTKPSSVRDMRIRETLRQSKNTFIAATVRASRAAIRGGLAVGDAFALSENYIRICEAMRDVDRITELQYRMAQDFAKRAERLARGRRSSRLAAEVAEYVRQHMAEPVSVEAMAKEFFMSRTYLSGRFRTEVGETLKDFILKEKTEEAKRLLRDSDKPLTAIALCTGFSSQSHFSRVFRKYTAFTPGEYRQKQSG